MWWRLTRAQFNAAKGDGNKQALQRLVESGEVPGLLAYVDDQPVGWCAIAPRGHYPVLERSRILKRVDDQPVWSIVCFFVSRPFRSKGVTTALLRAAVAYAKQQGATVVEGYPVEPKAGRTADVFVYTGVASTFLKAGFVEVLRRSETRPIMRYEIDVR
jgi:GNAT superfamily N-acetyltransferase